MKKHLIAAGVAAVFAAPAMAQSVTLYGLIDAGYGTKKIDNSAGVTQQKQSGVMDGGFAGNRIGFRGTEDLGGGVAAGFVIEQGISVTNPSQALRSGTSGMQLDGYATSTGRFDQGTGGSYTGNNRQSFVSLSSKELGELRAGFQYTTIYEIGTLMGFTTMSESVYGGSSSHLLGQAVAGGTRANGITYISPRINNFGLSIQTGSAGGRENTEFASAATNTAAGYTKLKNDRNSLKLDWAQGPFAVAFGHTQYKFEQSATGVNCRASAAAASLATASNALCVFNLFGGTTSPANGALTDSAAYKTKLNQVAGAYTAPNWKVGVMAIRGTYEVTDSAGLVTAGTGTAPTLGGYTAVGKYDIASQRVSGQYSIGAVDLIAGYGTSKVDVDGTKYFDLKEQQIGALYNFSKTTRAYVYMGSWKDRAAQATTNTKGSQTIAGIVKSF